MEDEHDDEDDDDKAFFRGTRFFFISLYLCTSIVQSKIGTFFGLFVTFGHLVEKKNRLEV